MRALGEAFDFSVAVHGEPGLLEPTRFRVVSVADAVRRLARGHQFVIRHRPDGAGEPAVEAVVLLARGAPPEATAPGPAGARRTDGVDQDRLIEIAALADLPAGEAIPELADLVEGDPEPAVRAAAIRALAALTDASAYPLIDIGLADEEASVRLAALRAQPPDRGDFPVSQIEEMAESDADPQVRELARSLLDEHYGD
jgi:HEAT repeat protein